MSGVTSCRQCGGSEIDTDPSRGDAVCTSCGFVLEESIIVSEVTFEEDGHGGASAVGQFVSAESRGGGGIGVNPGGFHSGIGKESREITLRAAKKRIMDVAQQLRLNQHCIDVSFNFFKMALHKQLTKGRKHPLTIAACVYMTCRMEGTPHLLIDFSDVAQMDVYALGRAYIQISRALFINIPSVDPCLYILRFAHKFNLGPKTHEVSVTALRLVQRMKRDWMHLGRRPSGLCGAALLIAARIHGFSRSVQDVINVVKVHETTLRRRLIEFGETPSSSLTMDEFMSVDLEEEHDPPAFKAARVKDRDHIQKLLDEGVVNEELKEMQTRIESELYKRKKKERVTKKISDARMNEESFMESSAIDQFTRTSINDLIPEEVVTIPATVLSITPSSLHQIKSETQITREIKREVKSETGNGLLDPDRLLMPPPPSHPIGIHDFDFITSNRVSMEVGFEEESGELDLTGIDDAEIDGYIMNKTEAERKRILWESLNNDYIVSQERKRIQLEQDIKDGKFDKKKKLKKEKSTKEKYQARTAGEAIKIMLEKKLSSKINYEVLKSLCGITNPNSTENTPNADAGRSESDFFTVIESGPVIPKRNTMLMKDDTSKLRNPRKRYKSESESMESLKSSSSVSVLIDPETKSIILKPIKADFDREMPKFSAPVQRRVVQEFEPEVVVETGPVVMESGPLPYHSDNVEEENEDADDAFDEEEEEEDEDETTLSASQLLTQFRGESEESYSNYY